MKKISEKITCYKIARKYYIDEIPQNQIAKMMGMSTAQVSRFLKKARNYNIVEISVNLPEEFDDENIKERFLKVTNIKDVIIANIPEESEKKQDTIKNSITCSAVQYLPEVIENQTYVGIGWGESIYQTAISLNYFSEPINVSFVPMVGNSGNNLPCYQVNSIVDRIAEKCKAKGYYMNAPAFSQDADMKKRYLESEEMRPLQEIWSKLDVAIFGLGGPWKHTGGKMQEAFGVSLEFPPSLEKNVGNIMGHFIDENGWCDIKELNEKFLSIPVKDLSKAKCKVCIAGGREKYKGIYTACKLSMIDVLVTDRGTIEQILEEYE